MRVDLDPRLQPVDVFEGVQGVFHFGAVNDRLVHGLGDPRIPLRVLASLPRLRARKKLLNYSVAANHVALILKLGGKLAMSDSETPPSGPPMDMSGVALEQLDTLVRVTTIQAWISLGTLFAVCAGAVLFAFLYRVPKKVVGEGILLIKRDRLSQVRALGTGRLVSLDVTLADIETNKTIGEIYQQDLKDTISETTARLEQLRDENEQLIRFETDERTVQGQAIKRLRDAISRTIDNSKEGLRIAVRIVEGSERLRHQPAQQSRLPQRLATEVHDSERYQYWVFQARGARSHTADVGERAATRPASAAARDQQAGDKLRLDGEKLDRTSRIVSHTQGTVTQILTAADEYVREGGPVVLLSSPKETIPGPDFVGPYECIVFVPAGEGKKIDVNNFVEVMPATIKREEHGFIHGKVVDVSELPATRLAMEAALQHPDLVETFLKRYSPGVLLRVHVKLEPRPGTDSRELDQEDLNRFRWSSSSGTTQKLKTGTLCEAAIVVEKQRLITLVVPWVKKLMDLH